MFEAAGNTTEVSEPLDDRVGRHPQESGDGRGTGCVSCVVQAGYRQREGEAISVRRREREANALPGLPDVGDPPVRTFRRPDTDSVRRRHQVGTVRIVDPDDYGTSGLLDEAPEGGQQFSVSAMVVEVVGLDIRHDRGAAGQSNEGSVALVGLDDQQVTAVPCSAGADLVHVASDDERGPDTRLSEDQGQHGSRRGLTVGPRDGDGAALRTDGGQDVCTTQHRDPRLGGGTTLRVPVGDGR